MKLRNRTRVLRCVASISLALTMTPPVEVAQASPADEKREAEAPPPGGYWGLSERPPKEPKDGEEEVVTGSILIPLGTLRAGAGLATYFAGTPGRCEHDTNDCANIRYVGIGGMGFGGLMFATGIVLLIVGLVRREQHRQWELSMFTPRRFDGAAPKGGGIALRLRF